MNDLLLEFKYRTFVGLEELQLNGEMIFPKIAGDKSRMDSSQTKVQL